ncbi:hypothetical protein MRB56_09285 [Halomonas cupida]|uniref:hypothetical protein n=1 Tax=Halomonas cupida TaxID=44933 RepID=UPI0039B6A1A8
MNNFELNSKACALSDSRSGYSLAREVLELRAERDAMADYVDRMQRVISEVRCSRIPDGSLDAVAIDEALATKPGRMPEEAPHESP